MHPALLKDSGWRYHQRVRILKAARWWGCVSPGVFDELPRSEKIDILALYEIEWRIEAINAYEANEEAKRASKKGSAKPQSNRPSRRR
jgi:hypothetical protein